MSKTELTHSQKLSALSMKYFSHLEWNPKEGDYYTSARDDLDLYQIVSIQNGYIETKYCDPDRGTGTEKWPISEFLQGFGEYRVFVPNCIFE